MKFKLFDKIRNKYTKEEGFIDCVIPGGRDRYRVKTKDSYEYWYGSEIESITGEAKKPLRVEMEKKRRLNHLG